MEEAREISTLQICVQVPHIRNWATRIIAQTTEASVVLKRRFPFTVNSIYHGTERVHVRRCDKYLI